jgi:hypothetical protein
MFRWSIQNQEGARFCAQELMPHLRIKGFIAGRFIEAIDCMKLIRNLDSAIKLCDIAYSLNPTRKLKKPLDIVKGEIYEIYGSSRVFTE